MAISIVASGLRLNSPGEIVLRDHKDAAITLVQGTRRRAMCFNAAHFQAADDAAESIEAATNAMSNRTRLFFFRRVVSLTGSVLPAKELCAKARRRDIISVVDGAHSQAMIPLNFDEVWADFYMVNLPKWWLAPSGLVSSPSGLATEIARKRIRAEFDDREALADPPVADVDRAGGDLIQAHGDESEHSAARFSHHDGLTVPCSQGADHGETRVVFSDIQSLFSMSRLISRVFHNFGTQAILTSPVLFRVAGMRSVLAFLLFSGAAFAAEPKAKPNVVVILAYDLGARDLGCTGSKYYRTPNLDAFAKAAVKLEEAYASGGGGDATQFSVLTGKSPARFNLHDSESLQVEPNSRKLKPPARVDELPKSVRTLASELLAAGYVTYHNGPQHQNFAREYFFDTKELGFTESEIHIPTFNDFLKRHSDKPFLIVWELRGKGVPNAKSLAKYKAGPLGTQGNPAQAVHVEAMDSVIGDLLKELDERKSSDNTIVMITTAGGAATVLETPETPITSNAPYREGKGYLYEGGIRIPFLLRGPGIKIGGFPIISEDVAPTLLGLCGIKSEIEFDGVNLAPQFRGESKPDPKREFHWHQPYYTPSFGKPAGAIRSGNYKLIEYFETDRRELFDLGKDLGESRNLAAEKPEVVQELAAKLAGWRKDVGAPMPMANPDYRPNPPGKDGSILLPARTAFVTGSQLRFEPAPHKNTLGYWTNPADTASFEFTADADGDYAVQVLQGAGKGSGGAEVEVAVGESKFRFTVKDTGGFQAFEKREVGTVAIAKRGIHTLTLTPKSKPGVAVMDIREIVLVPKPKK